MPHASYSQIATARRINSQPTSEIFVASSSLMDNTSAFCPMIDMACSNRNACLGMKSENELGNAISVIILARSNVVTRRVSACVRRHRFPHHGSGERNRNRQKRGNDRQDMDKHVLLIRGNVMFRHPHDVPGR